MKARYACFTHSEIVDCCNVDRCAFWFVARKIQQVEEERNFFRAACLHGTSIRPCGTNFLQSCPSTEFRRL